MFDLRNPWFEPLWRRIAVVAFLFGWTVVELGSGAMFWAALFLALGLWCCWVFFVTWETTNED